MSEWSKAGREGVRQIEREEGRKGARQGRKVRSGGVREYSELVGEWGWN